MSMLAKMAAAGTSAPKLYVDDVFSAYTYTGNGGAQSINNGIDLSGKGGMVWIKSRNNTVTHVIQDTVRGPNNYLCSDQTSAQATLDMGMAFNANGFSLNNNFSSTNGSGITQVSWTFRRAKKFFDAVYYTGNGVNGRQIPHDLGVDRGVVIIKRLDNQSNWMARMLDSSLSTFPVLTLNTNGIDSQSIANGYPGLHNAAFFNVYAGDDMYAVNAVGGSYVAYLFAHDPSPEGIIQCGTFTTDSSANATVALGWEPQFLMVKAVDSSGRNWQMVDTSRGFTTSGTDAVLSSNAATSEINAEVGSPTASGFQYASGAALVKHAYIAIRRSNKPPTSGAQVFNALSRGGNGVTQTLSGMAFAPDMILHRARENGGGFRSCDRLRGARQHLEWGSAGVEGSIGESVLSFNHDGVTLGTSIPNDAATYMNYFLRRSKGFFDIVCYSGNGASQTDVVHGLGVRPQFRVTKARDFGSNHWEVLVGDGPSYHTCLLLNSDAARAGSALQGDETTFTVYNQPGFASNLNTYRYVTYLFATLNGVSKVGSYVGNGSSQVVNCNFSAGARFILIKRTDAIGDWYVWDSVRGITAANDPRLSINATAAEVATDDSVDPHASGFTVNQVAATNINVVGANYIFLAIA